MSFVDAAKNLYAQANMFLNNYSVRPKTAIIPSRYLGYTFLKIYFLIE